ncbi:hypothetical protein I4F81_003229 [Pyropia yezoensis]|uniref:Uncharacterized protein n=1 Tax=Pyropia yezoensis TaxID=2788 RepID=A0ACC3BRL2_PYRYE|nr:hypothetical protein I4F81_003229 [Neopyropia yezoensis]
MAAANGVVRAPPACAPPVPSPLVTGLLNFIDAAPSPHHAVAAAAALLRDAGYVALSEASATRWALAPGGRYFFTRGGTSLVAFALDVAPSSIADVDLVLADTQPCAVGGAHGELLLAPRLDNLHSCYTALTALTAADATLAAETDVRVVALFDHEEVGSTSAVGANSAFLPSALARIHRSLPGGGLDVDAAAAAMTRSLLVSADMAHAVHPNYMAKHEERHRPALGGGMVIKTNANQRSVPSRVSGAG